MQGSVREPYGSAFLVCLTASDQSVRVKKLSAETRVPTRGSARAAGHDLYASEGTDVPARGQAIVGTGIVIELSHHTNGRIAP